MSSSSIPHLSTLLPRGGGLRGRAGRGRGRNPGENDDPCQSALHKDAAIQGTDNDAASSRASAVALGYLSDPYAQFFAASPPPRRYPLINRGTYVRTTALDRLIEAFLCTPSGNDDPKKQIISLGAGSDTRFFRLARRFPELVYHELDFATNTASKIGKILDTPVLSGLLPSDREISPDKTTLHSATLNIHALDLRSPPPTLPNMTSDRPTLLISECCLTYLPFPGQVLSHFLAPLSAVGIVQYDPLKPRTPFGRTMVANLAARGIAMPALDGVPTLEAHRRALRGLGMERAGGRTVGQIYASSTDEGWAWLLPGERARVERLEWLDEVEEWDLLAGHYGVTWGWRDGADGVFERAWGGIDGAWREDERADDELHEIPSPE